MHKNSFQSNKNNQNSKSLASIYPTVLFFKDQTTQQNIDYYAICWQWIQLHLRKTKRKYYIHVFRNLTLAWKPSACRLTRLSAQPQAWLIHIQVSVLHKPAELMWVQFYRLGRRISPELHNTSNWEQTNQSVSGSDLGLKVGVEPEQNLTVNQL